jgi:hypothetical protein
MRKGRHAEWQGTVMFGHRRLTELWVSPPLPDPPSRPASGFSPEVPVQHPQPGEDGRTLAYKQKLIDDIRSGRVRVDPRNATPWIIGLAPRHHRSAPRVPRPEYGLHKMDDCLLDPARRADLSDAARIRVPVTDYKLAKLLPN